jgi:hypothetical protein
VVAEMKIRVGSSLYKFIGEGQCIVFYEQKEIKRMFGCHFYKAWSYINRLSLS